MPDSAIEVSHVTKRFGAVVALDDASFSVKSGEVFFLLGPSGCGKTTLLRILAGLETPDAGTVSFDGRDIADLPPHMRGAPMVFQGYALWPHMTVKENVAFGLVERRVPRAEIDSRVADILKTVDLAGLENRTPGQLSGGQQQRVVLARALVLNPGIILLDEPLSNLDAKLRQEMREEIAALHAKSGITFVYVTHDQVEALSLADRMAVLSAGRISAVGAPGALYHEPPNRFCAEFLGEANLLRGKVEARYGEDVMLATAAGNLRCRNPHGLAFETGHEAICMIRPENLAPDSGEEPVNSFEAVAGDARTTGATVSVALDAGGVKLKATVLNRGGLKIAPGAKGIWSVPVRDTIVVADA